MSTQSPVNETTKHEIWRKQDAALAQSKKRFKVGIMSALLLAGGYAFYSYGLDYFGLTAYLPDKVVAENKQDKDGVGSRERSKQLQNEYLAQYEATLNHADISVWDETSVAEVKKQFNSAVGAYTQGKYELSVARLEKAMQSAEELISSWNKAYTDAIDSSIAAIRSRDLVKAQQQLNNAKQIKPSSADLQTLQARIKGTAKLDGLFRQLQAAKAENDRDKTISVLQQIVAIDPDDQASKKQLNGLVEARNEGIFQNHVNQGLKAFDQGQYKVAEDFQQRAAKIYPQREELKVLTDKLALHKRAQQLSATHKKLAAMKSKDDWVTLRQVAFQAQKIFPEDAVINNFVIVSTELLGLYKKMQLITADAERLQVPKFMTLAREIAHQSTEYQSLSTSFDKQLELLNSLITRYSLKHTVTIHSDNKTEILVKGVGTILPTKLKQFELTEGKYHLSAFSAGCQTKEVEILISAKSQNTFEVACND